jgi:hypothetical protein
MNSIKSLIKKVLPINIWDYLPESVFRFYAGKPLLISKEVRKLKNKLKGGRFNWDDLNDYSRIASYDNKRYFFESVIKKYDSSIEFKNIKDSKFVGDGRGVESLNCYRRVSLYHNGEYIECFEKIYKKSSIDLQKTLWFYTDIYPQIENDLRIPKLISQSGSNARAVYFEWIEELNDLNESETAKFFSELLVIFDKVKLSQSSLRKSEVINYTEDAFFQFSYERSKSWVESNIGSEDVLILNSLNDYVLSNRRISRQFVHGNLSRSNILKNRVVLDFDNCGYYPLEYETASFITSFHRFHSVDEFESILSSYLIHNDLFTDKLTFLFFTFVFYNREVKETRKKFLRDLWCEIHNKIPKPVLESKK